MRRPRGNILATLVSVIVAAGCGDDGTQPPTCEAPDPFVVGDATGHASPLGAAPGEARAGRVRAADLPAVPSGLATWKEGDFVLANDRVALVIEDVGDSDLYDPWGGRPVGLARVAGGRMIEPANFGEFFLLTGRSSLITEDVSVLADGSAGGPAIIRTVGRLHPMPFFESVTGGVFESLLGMQAAIDYELAPDSNRVIVRFRYLSDRLDQVETGGLLHALMYTKRTPVWIPGRGFSDDIAGQPYVGLIDDAATSWAYVPADRLNTALSVSGFIGGLANGFRLPACATFEREHAQIVIGAGPGLDGLIVALADGGSAVRTVTGTVTSGGAPVAGAHVHAVDDASGAHFTRGTTAADGSFAIHVPASATVRLDAVVEASQLASATAAPGDGPIAIAMPAPARLQVTVRDGDGVLLPARVQVFPSGAQTRPMIPASHGEDSFPGNRLRVLYETAGTATVAVPPGTWELVVSRGYEYGLHRRTVTVTAGQNLAIDAVLEHQVDTTGVQCGDFHIHTSRSNDSGDPALVKVASAIADGLELPVRSDHEYIADFAAEIAALGAQRWAAGFGSVELTSFELWGHMGVFPLTADPAAVNAGTPRWQSFPTADRPDEPFATLSPVTVFDAVRARPEAPVVIINHPRGNTNYFGYVGYDPITGMSTSPDWDTRFTLVEVFNDASWRGSLDGTVADWFGLLNAGRKIFAVGSSDSHGIASSPVGYPRTCLAVGTDDPRALTANQVRDTLAAGHGFVSGGIYVSARVGATRPGDTATGLGDTADVEVEIQAADWVDVDAIDVVVDGTIVDTIPILPGDADPANPTVRWRGTIPVDVRAAGGGFVVIAAYGDAALEPVHPGRIPFGVTNPIFLAP